MQQYPQGGGRYQRFASSAFPGEQLSAHQAATAQVGGKGWVGQHGAKGIG